MENNNPLKIAICFSGQIRTGTHAFQHIMKYIGCGHPDYSFDFFSHTWDIETLSQWEPIKMGGVPPCIPYPVDQIKIETFLKFYNPKRHLESNFQEYQNNITKCYGQNTCNPLLHAAIYPQQSIYECNELKKEYEIENNFKYDYVVRMRPDCIYNHEDNLIRQIGYIMTTQHRENNKIGYNEVYVNDRWNKIPFKMEDVLWIAKSDVMDSVCGFIKWYYSMTKHNPDLQSDLYEFVSNELGIYVKPLLYNNYEIYRVSDIIANRIIDEIVKF